MLKNQEIVLRILSQYWVLCIVWSIVSFDTFANSQQIASGSVHKYLSHQMNQQVLEIKTNRGLITLSALNQAAIEVVYHANNPSVAATHLPSYALKEKITIADGQLTESSQGLSFSIGSLVAQITKVPFSISYYQNDALLVREHRGFFARTITEENTTTNVHGVNFLLAEDEQLIGGGQRVVGMNRRGHRFPLYNRADYGYETHSLQMNYSIPAVISNKQYLLLFDNSAKGWMDIGKADPDILQFEAVAGRNAYIIVAGDSYAQLLNNYVDITGKQPLPPRWALGNFASRFGYHSQQEVLATADKFKQLSVPLDAIVIDLYWFGKDIKGHMGNLAWDVDTFPQPEKMMESLSKQGVKPILITEPFVLSSSKRWQDAVKQQALAQDKDGNVKTFDFYFGHTGIIDIFNDKGRRWFNNIYQHLNAQGVKGWWGDLGEPEVHPSDAIHTLDDGSRVSADAIHNVYGHQWAKMLFQQLQHINPTERAFILMRSGFAGSQRYGMIPWTGDVNRSWGGLKPQVELSLQMSMMGLAYTHSDLGGFAGGESLDKELYIRWLQFGVFQPIYRPHGQEHIPSEVVFHDQQTLDIIRKFIQLRYSLLPYNYTLAYQNSAFGLPLMRPLFFNQKKGNQQFTDELSYMWGDDLLIRPIVNPDIKSLTIDLPKGVWFSYFSGERFVGGQAHKIETPIDELPVFVKAGAFIPLANEMSSTQEYRNDILNLHYYADNSVSEASGQLFNDDGVSSNTIEQGKYELMTFSATHSDQQLRIVLDNNNYPLANSKGEKTVNIVVHNWHEKPKNIIANDKSVTSYSWNEATGILQFQLVWHAKPAVIKISNEVKPS